MFETQTAQIVQDDKIAFRARKFKLGSGEKMSVSLYGFDKFHKQAWRSPKADVGHHPRLSATAEKGGGGGGVRE